MMALLQLTRDVSWYQISPQKPLSLYFCTNLPNYSIKLGYELQEAVIVCSPVFLHRVLLLYCYILFTFGICINSYLNNQK